MIITKPDGTVMELNSIDDVEMMVREAELQAAQLGKPEVITPETLEQVERRKTEFPDPNSLVVPGAEELTALDLFLGKKLFEFNGERLPRSLEARLQTMTTGGVGTGTELLDTAMLAQLWSDVHLATRVAPAFGPPIQMPTKTLDLPEELGDVTFYKPSGEGIAVTATDLATAKRAMTAYPLKAQVDVSDEEDQDAIIALLPMIRSSLVRNAGEVIDDVLINGDASTGTQNINQYNASGGTNIATDSKYLIGFDGLSHYCLNEVTGQTSDLGALADADYGTLIGLLGKYAANPDRLAWIMDPFAYAKALFLSEFRTMDKLGQFATVLTGQVGAVNSSPVLVSGQMVKANATGQVDETAASNTKGRLLLVNRDMWKVGVRQGVRIELERSVAKGLTSIIITFRIGFQTFGDRSAAKYSHTALGYNITV